MTFEEIAEIADLKGGLAEAMIDGYIKPEDFPDDGHSQEAAFAIKQGLESLHHSLDPFMP